MERFMRLVLAHTRYRFGFIKYHNFEDAEDCIRGFHYLGYEVSFARVRLSYYIPHLKTNLDVGILLLKVKEIR